MQTNHPHNLPEQEIEGIKCDVKNCVYNDGQVRCHAGEIEVGPNFAVSCADTVCATFKSK